MLSLLVLSVASAPAVVGTYETRFGRVGSGGISRTLTLRSDKSFTYRSRGCFTQLDQVGTYRQNEDLIVLARPDAEPTTYRLVSHDTALYLVEKEEKTSLNAGDLPYELVLKRRS